MDSREAERTLIAGSLPSSDVNPPPIAHDASGLEQHVLRDFLVQLHDGAFIAERIRTEPVDFRIVSANPAFETHTGIELTPGTTLRTLLPEIDNAILDTYVRVMETSRSERFTTQAIDRHFEVEAIPAGVPERIVVIFRDVTAQHQAASAMRESQERQAFLLSLSDALRAEADPRAVERIALEMLAEQLSTDRAYITTSDYGKGETEVPVEVRRDDLPPLVGVFSHAEYPESARLVNEGTFVVHDVEGDTSLSDVNRRSFEAIRISAVIGVGLRKGSGDIFWTLAVATSAPRCWSRSEILLMEEAAERIWAAVARAQAEAELSQGAERLRLGAEVARFGLWDWDLATGAVTWSDEHFRMQGYAVGEVVPSYEAWAARVHPDDLAATEAAITHARDARVDFAREFRSRHPDGSIHWLSARGRFFHDASGTPVRMIGAMLETTERRQWEEHQKVLVAELQHRTFNLMGVVRMLADATIRSSASLQDFREKFRDRIAVLARVQRLLSRLDERSRTTFDELLRGELDSVGAFQSGRQVNLEGPRGVPLRSSSVQMLAMAIHELATNAVKYGALRQSGARLGVTWRVIEEDDGRPWLHVAWRESGVAMPASDCPQGTGQGRELIERALPYQLQARTTYELAQDGVHCTIAVPASALKLEEVAHAAT